VKINVFVLMKTRCLMECHVKRFVENYSLHFYDKNADSFFISTFKIFEVTKDGVGNVFL
jgi:hypothetical protein